MSQAPKPALYEPDLLAGTTPTNKPMPGSELPDVKPLDPGTSDAAQLMAELTSKSFVGRVPMEGGQLVPHDLEGVQRIANGLAKSGLRKQGRELTPAQWWVILTAGYSAGLTTGEIMKNVDLVNDRPVLWGEAIPALIWRSGKCGGIEDSWEGTGPTRVAVCTMHRVTPYGAKSITRRFGAADAKQAGLLSKDTYQKFPDRMFQVRARAWAAKDLFPDVLGGMGIAEEAMDVGGFDPDRMAASEPSAAVPPPTE